MSLFPAYANQPENPEERKTEDASNWLINSSFQIDLNKLNQPTSSKSSRPKDRVSHKHKKKRQKRTPTPVPVPVVNSDDFRIDTTRTKEFLSVRTISRPSVPKYRVSYYTCNKRNNAHKQKFKRYFNVIIKKDDKADEAEIITKKDLNKEISKERDENFTGFKQEEEMSQTTAYYNRRLAEDPSDIEMWLKYVRFQDDVFNFEKSFRKGSIAKGLRVTAERKLAILDKALTHNPNCEKLLRERLNITVSVYPADELQVQLKKIVEKDPGNIILWQGYIEATQCSMSHCNTPAVLNLYIKCLSTLHQLRRSSAVEKSLLEESILRMLYQCGLFLKQAGLFEQLWTLLKLYLELNLSDKNKFMVEVSFDEKQLVELEEIILKSQLPLHELWLRVEKLRESCHWLPFAGEANCEDPQRLVFPEDVSELIHPITMPENIFKVTATILTLLKAPLLPCRHTTMQLLGLDYVPWSLDSVESLLPMFLPEYPIDLSNRNLLKDTNRLTVGPQYLKAIPGQDEYLEFLIATIRNCADCLSGYDQIAITVWWFRFQRLLIVLDRENRFKMNPGLRKKIRASMKNLLKQDEHRNNAIYYREYALVEFESGNFEAAVSVLTNTAILLTGASNEVTTISDEDERAAICSLYRTLIELQIRNNSREKALKYLVCLALNKNIKTELHVTEEMLNDASLKFKHVTLKLLTEAKNLELVRHFLPNFLVDWIVCHGWILYLTKGPIETGVFVENILITLNEQNPENSWHKEIINEFYVAMLFKHCIDKPQSGMFKLLDESLHKAIASYPNNLFLLSVLAKEQSLNCCLGQSWWKLTNLLLKTGHAIPILFLVFIINQHVAKIEETLTDTVTGQPVNFDNNLKNRMVSLFRRITRPDICTRRCGLVWRLYLQFLHANFDPSLCRKAYYAAVEECPWLKALYIDAAIYIPTELAQIQDLLLEKQLRLHVTPEELDILRT